jgi:hypothetical protein
MEGLLYFVLLCTAILVLVGMCAMFAMIVFAFWRMVFVGLRQAGN